MSPHPTSRDSDPLLRAIATGDEHCPDGKALAQLGRLIRGQQPLPSDLRARVETRLAVDEGHLASDDDERVDRLYDHGGADPELDRLRGLFTGIGPAPVDLRARVRRQLMASQRLAPISAEAPISSRAQAEQTLISQKRLRVLSMVVIGHLAAVLMIAIMFANRAERAAPEDHGSTWTNTVPPVPPVLKVLERGPHDWTQIPGSGFDLFALRRTPELRAAARARFNTERSAGAVACGLRWLLSKQASDGRFTIDGDLPLSAVERDAVLSSHALATLALLGEGGGGTSVDRERMQAAQRALTALDRAPLLMDAATGPIARAQVALARVEGALLGACPRAVGDAAIHDLAERLDATAALEGFAMLTVETAQQGGIAVPAALLERSRSAVNSLSDPAEANPSRLGTALFARATLGYRDNPATMTLSDSLAALAPSAAMTADTPVPTETHSWLFATLALREMGGPAWDAWIAGLQSRLLPSFIDAGPGMAYVAANPARPGDAVLTTANVILDLQVAYRYLPLSR